MPRRTLGPPRPCLVPALATMQHHCKAVLGAYAEIICICRRIPNAPARPAIILMPRAYVYTHTHRAYTRNIHSHVRYQTLRRVLPLMPRAYVYTHTHIREIYTPHVRYPVRYPVGYTHVYYFFGSSYRLQPRQLRGQCHASVTCYGSHNMI